MGPCTLGHPSRTLGAMAASRLQEERLLLPLAVVVRPMAEEEKTSGVPEDWVAIDCFVTVLAIALEG